jgi:hypothetical protein
MKPFLQAGALVLVLAGCGAGHVSAPQITNGGPNLAQPSVKEIAAAHERAAAHAAQQLLARAALPPGATPLRSRPSGWGGALLNSGPAPLAKVVDRVGFWQTSAGFTSVVALERAHAPAGFRLEDVSGPSPRPPRSQVVSFSAPLASHRPSSKLLTFTVVRLPRRTVIRVDAKAVWMYPRSPREVLPLGVRAVDVESPNTSLHVTDQPEVQKIVRWFDALPITPPGVATLCPLVAGPVVNLSFRSAGGALLATAAVPAGAWVCDTIAFSIGGHRQTPLIDQLHGPTFVDRLQALLGVQLVPQGQR